METESKRDSWIKLSPYLYNITVKREAGKISVDGFGEGYFYISDDAEGDWIKLVDAGLFDFGWSGYEVRKVGKLYPDDGRTLWQSVKRADSKGAK